MTIDSRSPAERKDQDRDDLLDWYDLVDAYGRGEDISHRDHPFFHVSLNR